jgi:hypothetical protein
MSLVSTGISQPDRVILDFISILFSMPNITADFTLFIFNRTSTVIRKNPSFKKKIFTAVTTLLRQVIVCEIVIVPDGFSFS